MRQEHGFHSGQGRAELRGEIPIAGAKNACLTLMPATLLTDGPLTLTNAPRLSDIRTMTQLLQSLGAEVQALQGGRVLALSSHDLTSQRADYDIVRKMRASILVLGPLLARHGQAVVSLPGGCAIGARPVDLHLKALEALGATLDLREGYVHATANGGLKGAVIEFPFVSVGATENALMAATLAKGTTRSATPRASPRSSTSPAACAHGRADRGRRHLHPHRRGRHRPAGRRDASGRHRPDRAWHLHARPRDHRGRGRMPRRPDGPCRGLRPKLDAAGISVEETPRGLKVAARTAASARSTWRPPPSPASRPTCRRR
jgi:UDP-N-acetylglucosamine 1-carboxyvinyltransferase